MATCRYSNLSDGVIVHVRDDQAPRVPTTPFHDVKGSGVRPDMSADDNLSGAGSDDEHADGRDHGNDDRRR